MIRRISASGASYHRCSRSVIAPGWGNLGWLPNPPWIRSNTEAIWRTAPSSNADEASHGFVEGGIEDPPDGVGLGRHLVSPGTVGIEHSGQHGAKAGAAVPPVGREVGPTVEHFAGGREEGGERPATLTGDRLDGVLVAGIDVGPLVPIHFDADEVLVEELGQT